MTHVDAITRSADHIQTVITRLFAELELAGITYAVLREADRLPQAPEHDIDLLIQLEAVQDALRVVRYVAEQSGWVVRVQTAKCDYRMSLLTPAGLTAPFIAIDIFSSCHYRSLEYVSASQGLNTRRRTASGIWSVQLGFEAAYVVLKDTLSTGTIRGRVRDLVAQGARDDRQSFVTCAAPAIGLRFARELCDLAVDRNWSEIVSKRRWLLLAMCARQGLEFHRRFRYFLSTWRHYRRRAFGLFVVVLGPDGSGKTTVAKALCDDLFHKPFKKCFLQAMSFGILPHLSTLLLRKRANATFVEAPIRHNDTRPLPAWHSIVIVIWYALDMMFGRLVIWRSRGLGAFVINARYFYDYYFQPGHRRTPVWMLRLAERLIAKPDIVFFIDRDAEQIYHDKPELPIPEIREQQRRIRELLPRLPGAVRIDGRSGVEATVTAARDAILGRVGLAPSKGQYSA